MQPRMWKLCVFAVCALFASNASATTLDDVRANGMLRCGVSQSLTGFANIDDDGRWQGIDVDLCRAVAVAVLGSVELVAFVPLSSMERFTALQSGEIEVLTGSTTWSFSRDVGLALEFVGVNHYDGQGFMVPLSLGVGSALELDGAAVCTNQGTTSAQNLTDFFRANGMTFELVTFERMEEALGSYISGRCDAFSTDRSGLNARRLQSGAPDDHVILSETISKEPLGIAVRQGDDAWADIVRWTLNAMIAAEELGVTSQNAGAMRTSDNPEIRRLLGSTGDLGLALGLDAEWAFRIIVGVGNFGESFERNMGAGSPLGLNRGMNALWTEGGLIYSPPFR